MSLGPMELLVILGIVLLLFGPSRLPGLGKSIGEAIRGFKKGIADDEVDVTAKDSTAKYSSEKLESAKKSESVKSHTEDKSKV
ncbi:MAG: Sec-independent protein translocase TatA [Bdellovibrionales bacterium CG10_big_fil_rev_8_21_14_0_10_45_34]|nr:MAG: Sec-independent protein translocase TatA [Bdellovibrionales bacterium CG10_big_fil_rev_8_21_14_0_10_45_34]